MTLLYDPVEAIAALRQADPHLGLVIDRAGPFTMRPPAMQSPFESLARAIVYQQLSGKAAGTIYSRLKAQLPGRHGFRPEPLLELSDETLRAVGISGNKAKALRDLAEKTLAGVVPRLAELRRMPDEEIIARLTQVRGIGRWTVEMLLIFRLGRPDVLPLDDLGVRKGFMLTYGMAELPNKAALTAHAERWRPYRTVASWYMWRSLGGGQLLVG